MSKKQAPSVPKANTAPSTTGRGLGLSDGGTGSPALHAWLGDRSRAFEDLLEGWQGPDAALRDARRGQRPSVVIGGESVMFRPGMIVVCVDDSPCAVSRRSFLIAGQVYRVRDAEPAGDKWVGGAFAVRLEEVRLPPLFDGEEGAYRGERFRPVKEQGFGLLRAALAPAMEDA